jgi:hypothetical protein
MLADGQRHWLTASATPKPTTVTLTRRSGHGAHREAMTVRPSDLLTPISVLKFIIFSDAMTVGGDARHPIPATPEREFHHGSFT